jgi:hypothetical protein
MPKKIKKLIRKRGNTLKWSGVVTGQGGYGFKKFKNIYLPSDFPIFTSSGWLRVSQIAGMLEDGESFESNAVACPICNTEHSIEGGLSLGYAIPYRNDGILFLNCMGAACRSKFKIMYHCENGVETPEEWID